MNFQDIVMRLNAFWSQQGCCIVAADDTEKGAGTFSHHTFLRSLGPEPCRIAHIDPSRRPKDGRYGENPNRLQLFHQYQVVLKPAPANIVQLYLESLEAIGLSQKEHDIRFVQDDWESPTLGAWGLGWEVWCDGMEITQFTYFQSVAGLEMEKIPVEIAYGLERLSMFINNKSSVYDVPFGGAYSYRDLYHLREVQCSRYNLEEASGELWFNLFDLYAKEVKRLVSLNLPIPAYDFVNKASHAFNMLDARGLISVTERQSYILRVRELAALTAHSYLELRRSMNFPLLNHDEEKELHTPLQQTIAHHTNATHEDFLLEIFSEDLPAHYVPNLSKELEKHLSNLFQEQRISYASIESFSTHRRLSVIVDELAATTQSIEQIKKGPSLAALFGADHLPTPVAKSFFQSIQKPILTPQQLQSNEDPSLWIEGGYLFHKKVIEPQDTLSLLQEHLPKIITALKTPKSMRWNASNAVFARPIRGLICLFGKELIPISFAGVQSGKTTYGHRQRGNHKIEIHHPGEYIESLKKHHVIVDPSKRDEMIRGALPEGTTGMDRLAQELLYLSEYPKVGIIHFDEKFLRLPHQLIELEMIVHQRYLPIYHGNQLTNKAAVVVDVDPTEEILENNARVLRARLSDGAFFFDEDRKMGLEAMTQKLDRVIFQKDLGSYQDKIGRMLKIAHHLAPHMKENLSNVLEALRLSKADLNSNVVGEFPELQGLMGSLYAKDVPTNDETARAIQEQYLPQQESDSLPSTKTGKIVSLIDKLDNILAFSTANLLATSSKDPYAQRRQALAIVKILKELSWSIDLEEMVVTLLKDYPHTAWKEKNQKEPLQLLRSRLKSLLLEEGFQKEEIEALTAVETLNIPKILLTAHELRALRQDTVAFKEWLEMYRRVKGQAVNHERTVEPKRFVTPEENEFFDALQSMVQEPTFNELFTLKPKVDALFNHVHINDINEELKYNRQQMLWCSTKLFEQRLNPTMLLGLI